MSIWTIGYLGVRVMGGGIGRAIAAEFAAFPVTRRGQAASGQVVLRRASAEPWR